MICFNCGHKKTRISNSRYVPTQYRTWRRHTCPQCQTSMTTHESIDASQLLIQDTTPFRATRLLLSIAACLEHYPKSDRSEIAEALCNTVLVKLLTFSLKTQKLTEEDIAHLTHQTLKQYDRLACVQYAARHSRYLGKHLR